MRLTRAMMLAASCLAAAALGINASDGAFAQGAETQSKTCRVTRAKDVEIQRDRADQSLRQSPLRRSRLRLRLARSNSAGTYFDRRGAGALCSTT